MHPKCPRYGLRLAHTKVWFWLNRNRMWKEEAFPIYPISIWIVPSLLPSHNLHTTIYRRKHIASQWLILNFLSHFLFTQKWYRRKQFWGDWVGRVRKSGNAHHLTGIRQKTLHQGHPRRKLRLTEKRLRFVFTDLANLLIHLRFSLFERRFRIRQQIAVCLDAPIACGFCTPTIWLPNFAMVRP